MVKSQVFFFFCLSFIGGIFLNTQVIMQGQDEALASSHADIPRLLMLGFLILGIILITVLWQYKKLAVTGFCFLFLIFGSRYYLLYLLISLLMVMDIASVIVLLFQIPVNIYIKLILDKAEKKREEFKFLKAWF